ncbi:MAG TPA: hypothetical protein VIK95_06440 [Egibacteraceae bacterium]
MTWWNQTRGDHLTTTDPARRGKVGDTRSGYRCSRIEGDVRPAPGS